MFLQLQQFPSHQHILAEVLFYSDLYNKCHISKTTNQTFVNFPRFPTQLVVLSCHQILINMISNTCKTTAGFFPLCVSEVYKPCVCVLACARVYACTHVSASEKTGRNRGPFATDYSLKTFTAPHSAISNQTFITSFSFLFQIKDSHALMRKIKIIKTYNKMCSFSYLGQLYV